MSDPIRVLYVDDYDLDRERVRDVLEKEHGGFCITEAASRQEFEARLAEGGFDLVLTDFNILGFEGLEVIDAVRARDPRVPVVMVTGIGSQEVAVEAMKRGAADYVIKSPERIQRLPRTIQMVMEKKLVEDERQWAEGALEEARDELERRVEERTAELARVNEALRLEIVERKGAEGEAQRHLERVRALREIDRAITSTLDLTEVLDIILRELERVIPYHSAGIFLFSEGIAKLAAGRGFPDMESILQLSFPVKDDPLTCQLLRDERPLVLGDAQADARFLARGGTTYVRSWIGVPLIAKGEAIGFLGVDHGEPGVYGEESMQMAQAFASQVAIALENARLYEAARQELAARRRAEEETGAQRDKLEGIIASMTDGVDIVSQDYRIHFQNRMLRDRFGDLTGKLCYEEYMARETPCDFCPMVKSISTGSMQRTELTGGDGREYEIRSSPFQDIDGETKVIEVVRDITERKQAEEEAAQLAKFPSENPNPVLRVAEDGTITYANKASLPLLSVWACQVGQPLPDDWHEFTLGVFSSGLRKEAEVEYEDRILSLTFAPIVDAGYVNVYGLDITERKRAGRLLQALNKAALAVERALTHGEIFDAVAREFKKLGFSCIVFLTDESQKRLIPEYFSYEAGALRAIEKLTGLKAKSVFVPVETAGIYGRAISEKRTVFVENAEDVTRQMLPEPAKRFAKPIVRMLKIPKSIAAPLVVEDEAIGLLSVQSDDLTEEDIPAITAFAHQMAAAWRKAQLIKDLQISLAEVKRSQEELQHTAENLRRALGATIQAMALTVETRDPYTAGHQRRVADLARAIATQMGLPKEQIEGIRMAGVIHDIGKITIPAEILSRPGRLGDLEFGLIKTHSQAGFDVLKTIDFPWPVAQIVLQHHERMDGSGYPQGLSGDEIMLEARVLAVADVVEAMASFRPYRPALGIDKALEEISQNRGVLYDPEVADACLKLVTEQRFRFE